jgi:hypothetical protein
MKISSVGFFVDEADWLRTTPVDCRCIQRFLDVGGVNLLDHFDAGPAVLGNLINVRSFHQSEADIGMPQTVERALAAITIQLHSEFAQNRVE